MVLGERFGAADNVTLRKNDVKARQEKIWCGDDSLFEVTNLKIE